MKRYNQTEDEGEEKMLSKLIFNSIFGNLTILLISCATHMCALQSNVHMGDECLVAS